MPSINCTYCILSITNLDFDDLTVAMLAHALAPPIRNFHCARVYFATHLVSTVRWAVVVTMGGIGVILHDK